MAFVPPLVFTGGGGVRANERREKPRDTNELESRGSSELVVLLRIDNFSFVGAAESTPVAWARW